MRLTTHPHFEGTLPDLGPTRGSSDLFSDKRLNQSVHCLPLAPAFGMGVIQTVFSLREHSLFREGCNAGCKHGNTYLLRNLAGDTAGGRYNQEMCGKMVLSLRLDQP